MTLHHESRDRNIDGLRGRGRRRGRPGRLASLLPEFLELEDRVTPSATYSAPDRTGDVLPIDVSKLSIVPAGHSGSYQLTGVVVQNGSTSLTVAAQPSAGGTDLILTAGSNTY